jgi:magnesium transporter
LDPDEPARLECEPNHIAIVFKRPKNYSGEDQLLFKATTVGVFFFGEFLIIVLSEDTNLFEGKPFSRVSSPREVLLKLIYRSIFHFLEHLKIINLLSDEVEQKINRAMENRFLINLFTLQKSLVYYQKRDQLERRPHRRSGTIRPDQFHRRGTELSRISSSA